MMTKKQPFILPEEPNNAKSSKNPLRTAPETSQASQHGTAAADLSTAIKSSIQGFKGPISRIVIRYDVGFNNTIYLRGTGPNLGWDKGTLLKNTSPDEWVWETDLPFEVCEFKVLVNDKDYENGENHLMKCGSTISYTPKF